MKYEICWNCYETIRFGCVFFILYYSAPCQYNAHKIHKLYRNIVVVVSYEYKETGIRITSTAIYYFGRVQGVEQSSESNAFEL